MNTIIINHDNCMSRKNMKNDIHKQCQNKKKFGDYCGIHKNGKCKLRIDQNLEDYKNSNKNISISVIKKNLNKLNIPIDGNKRLLTNRYKLFMENINSNIEKIIKIQRTFKKYLLNKTIILRGPALYDRLKCNNITDFYSMDNIIDLQESNFFSYIDTDNFIYGFDIESFKKLLSNNSINPYNRNQISQLTKDNFNLLVKLINILKIQIKIDEKPIFTEKPKFDQKILKIFQMIDQMGYHTDISWFKNLNMFQLKNFYKCAEDIWNYRAGLENEMKKRIIPELNCFKYCIPAIYAINNYNKLQHIILDEIEKFVTSGLTSDDKHTGTLYMLTALTEVSPECANAMPWLLQNYY